MELGLVFLGTSAAVPTPERGLPCIALVHRGSVVVLDAGEGAQERLIRAGLSPLRVAAVLVTHMHGDHVFGVPGLLQSMAMAGRRAPLLVAGPPGIRRFLEAAAMSTYWLPPFPLVVEELEPGDRVRLPNGFEAEAFEAEHGVPALGYRLVEPPRRPRVDMEKARRLGLRPGPLLSRLQRGEPVEAGGRVIRPEEVLVERRRAVIVYTGDTRPTPRVVEAARGADVLVHDSTFASDMAEKAHSQGHSTALDAARAAAEAGAGILVLFHISARYRDASRLAREARRLHPRVLAAEDYMKLVLRP